MSTNHISFIDTLTIKLYFLCKLI